MPSEVGYRCLEVACWPKEKATRRYAGVTHTLMLMFLPMRGLKKSAPAVPGMKWRFLRCVIIEPAFTGLVRP